MVVFHMGDIKEGIPKNLCQMLFSRIEGFKPRGELAIKLHLRIFLKRLFYEPFVQLHSNPMILLFSSAYFQLRVNFTYPFFPKSLRFGKQ